MGGLIGTQVVVVGSLNMDLVVRTARLPHPGETLLGSSLQMLAGGKGLNQAVAASRLGAAVAMVGRLGADAYGDDLASMASVAGVDIALIRRDAVEPTGTAHITVDDLGANTIIVVAGANGRLSVEDVDAAGSMIEQAFVLLVQLEVPLAAVQRALELARRGGAITILNPAPAAELSDDLIGLCDLVVPNETEATLLTGRDEPAEAAEALRARGARTVVVTVGERGAVVADDHGVRQHPSPSVAVVDTTAAGDAFCGALAALLAEGLSLDDALRWALGAGALATTRPGAVPAIPTRAEVASLLAH